MKFAITAFFYSVVLYLMCIGARFDMIMVVACYIIDMRCKFMYLVKEITVQ